MEKTLVADGSSQAAEAALDDKAEARRELALISARLERLPFSRWHGKVLATVATGHLFDAFDAVTIAFVLPVLVVLWNMTPGEVGLLISVGYLGQFIGALLMGSAAERFGRLPTFRVSLVIIALFSFSSVFAWGLGIFLVFRFMQGIGLGGEVPVAATYMNELSPAKNRGRIIFTLQSGFALGTMVTGLIAVWIIPKYGWQSMFVVGSLPIILAAILPRLAPESPRWLAANGQIREADRIVTQMENRLSSEARAKLPPLEVVTPPLRKRPSFGQLFNDGLAARTVGVWIIACCTSLTGYGLIAWMPTLYRTEYQLPVETALRYGMISNAVGFIAIFIGVLLIDYIGRRLTFMLGFFGSAVPMLYMAYVGTALPAFQVMVYASISLMFITFLLGGLYVYAPEIYPTRIRATGAGAASAWLRIGSIIGPVIVGALLTHASIHAVFVLFGGAAILGGLAVLTLGLETKGRALDEIAS
ncbi:MFS transporter [Pusillimonas noertemannii]|uniref:Putative MFS transporter n=1 Tax=Pusillimonas noertemannii TaxID=305977 RepID=A0A2U1CQ20_9BURK|nr:MFS transporter [Pusillimonas noertemannii]NYT67238.1 MFS transporter [Pusillimonas noertemannii]PVY67911.1 putative MFS transporter [Pusillimonas noertemannii]